MTDLAVNPGINTQQFCQKCQCPQRLASDLSPKPAGGPWYYLHSDIDCLRHVLQTEMMNIQNMIKMLDNTIREAHHLQQRY